MRLNHTCGSRTVVLFLVENGLGLLFVVVEGFVDVRRVERHGQNKIVLEHWRICILVSVDVRQKTVVLVGIVKPAGSGAWTCGEAVIRNLGVLRHQQTRIPCRMRVVKALVLILTS